ncbi:3-oxoacyl-[acyl-carrier-protein] synthase II [Anaerolineae bacterium]|nr:3-oxoacyl-[acyl-carrier-protein] synthase II [Anaerolineae bacterium]
MSAIDAMTMTPVEMLTDRRLTPMELEQLSTQARNKRTRVVITGMGAITPLGLTPEDFWQSLLAGKSGIAPVTLFDPTPYKTRIAAQVKDFDPRRYLDSKDARRLGRATAFAVAAARGAIADAGFKDHFEESARVGVVVGNAIGGFVEGIREHDVFLEKGPDRVSPFTPSVILPNMPAFYIAMYFNARGYNATISTACAAGTQAIGDAAEMIRHGVADVMVAGGCEAIIADIVFAAFGVMRAMSTRNDEPTRASRPFDKDRDGFVLGEGSAMLILEKLEHALARGAKIYAEVLGHGVNSDAYHFAAPDPQGTGATLVMKLAMHNAGVTPDQVDYINAHGTSTPLNDAGESLAIKQAFGERASTVPISSTKSMIGHSMGAAGAFEAVVCTMTLRDQKIHPTINYETPDPVCDLDYVPNQARNARVNITLSNSFGLGGQNACLVLGRYKE